MAFSLTVNGFRYVVDAEPDTPLLWAIRDAIDLTGTKYGCGIGQCGACTVHVNGRAVRSCSIPVKAAVGATITTIEGLSVDCAYRKLQTVRRRRVSHFFRWCFFQIWARRSRGTDLSAQLSHLWKSFQCL